MSFIHPRTPGTRDPHLPTAHLRPEANWINDPNGLVHHRGWYHVFFQHNPYAPTHQQVHWGHYRSRDLIHWEQQPLALTPTPGGEDADGCFSGNAVSAGGRITAFYSAHRADRWWQPVAAADSDPDGVCFTKRQQLVAPDPPEGVTTYRDPYVWRTGNGWRMLVGAGLAGGEGAALLYESDDLAIWSYRGPFHRRADRGAGVHTGEAWECPQLAVYEDGRILLITSSWYRNGGPGCVAAWTGTGAEADRGRFGDPYRLDYGPDFYAPALLPAPDGRWLLWGWSWEARDERCAKEAGWAGMLTLPREVTLDAEGYARQRPASELEGLRHGTPLRARCTLGAGQTADLGPMESTAELVVRLDLGAEATGGLGLVFGPHDAQRLDFEIRTGELVVDRSRASPDPRAHGGAYRVPLRTAVPGGSPEFRVLLDRSIAEVFTDAGDSLTLRCYPGNGGPWRLEARGPGTGETALDLEVHTLRTPEEGDRPDAGACGEAGEMTEV